MGAYIFTIGSWNKNVVEKDNKKILLPVIQTTIFGSLFERPRKYEGRIRNGIAQLFRLVHCAPSGFNCAVPCFARRHREVMSQICSFLRFRRFLLQRCYSEDVESYQQTKVTNIEPPPQYEALSKLQMPSSTTCSLLKYDKTSQQINQQKTVDPELQPPNANQVTVSPVSLAVAAWRRWQAPCHPGRVWGIGSGIANPSHIFISQPL